MTEPGRRSRWWVDGDEPEDVEAVEDPWSGADDELGLSDEQVRFLGSLADQPPASRLSRSLPGLDADLEEPGPEAEPGTDPGAETGD